MDDTTDYESDADAMASATHGISSSVLFDGAVGRLPAHKRRSCARIAHNAISIPNALKFRVNIIGRCRKDPYNSHVYLNTEPSFLNAVGLAIATS